MKKIQINLSILPNPIRIWGLSIGDCFALSENGINKISGNTEIYRKISLTRAILISHTDKPILRIPKLAPKDVGYPVIEQWALIEE